jgi:hypothetical protein
MSPKWHNSPHAKTKVLAPPRQVKPSERRYRASDIALRDVVLNQPEERAEHSTPRRRVGRRFSSQNDSDWGRGDERRLKRLLEFVQRADLKQVSERDLEQLQYEIAGFCLIEGRRSIGVGRLSRETVLSSGGFLSFGRRKLAAKLRADINDALKGVPLGPVPVKRTIEYDRKEKKVYEYFDAKPEALLRWNTQTLILRCAGRIHKCICGRLFIKVKRQIHCSAQCAQKRYSAAYRTDPANRQKIADGRHASYKKKVRKEKGTAVALKVRRRPRIAGERDRGSR